jgi:hypothetical protein
MALSIAVIAVQRRPCIAGQAYRLASGLSPLSLAHAAAQFQGYASCKKTPRSCKSFEPQSSRVLNTMLAAAPLSPPTPAPLCLPNC